MYRHRKTQNIKIRQNLEQNRNGKARSSLKAVKLKSDNYLTAITAQASVQCYFSVKRSLYFLRGNELYFHILILGHKFIGYMLNGSIL